MLVLTRRLGEKLHVGDSVVIAVVSMKNGRVRIGVEAPAEVAVIREELRHGAACEAVIRNRE